MNTFYYTRIESPVGTISLAVNEDGALAVVCFSELAEVKSHLTLDAVLKPDAARAASAAAELQAYFAGELQAFLTPVKPVIGTPFQRRVWMALARIPFGETWSYARLAAETGSVARAVGAANGANPISIVVPCHRVIGANGSLTGYAGGLDRKRALLLHEDAILV